MPRLSFVLMIGFAALAAVGLTAGIAEVSADTANVGAETWLRLAITCLLVATVVGQLLAAVSRSGPVRRAMRLIGRRRQPPPAPASRWIALDMVSIADLARRARAGLGTANTIELASTRSARLMGALSWWPLVVLTFVVVAAWTLLSGYMLVTAVLSDGLRAELWWQAALLALAVFSAFAVWRIGRRSWRQRRNRHRRRLVRRLLRFLGLGGRPAGTLGAPGGLSFAQAVPQMLLVGIAASGALLLGGWSALGFAADGGPFTGAYVGPTGSPTPAAQRETDTPATATFAPPSPSVDSTAASATPAVETTPTPAPNEAVPSASSAPQSTGPSEPPPTAEPSATATATQAPTAKPTATPTASPTPKITPSPTPSPTPTPKPTPSPTPKITPSPSPTPTPTPATPTPCTAFGQPDADCDGASDDAEKQYGSDPEDAGSTPESASYDVNFNKNSCGDGKDNDGDGDIDLKDSECG